MFRNKAILFAGLIAAGVLSGQAFAQNDPWANSYKFEAAGNFAQAAQQMETLAQKNEFAQLRLAYLLYLQARYPDAIRAYQRAQEMNKESFDAVLGISLVLLAQGRWNEAAAQASWVLQNAPGNYVAHLRMLVAEEGQANWKALATRADEMVRRYPSDATMWVYVARAAAATGNKTRAADAYQRVLQIVPGHIEANKYLGR
ncbi:MAG: tetratricopeptide repeat protein [Burkholderiales bacterium]